MKFDDRFTSNDPTLRAAVRYLDALAAHDVPDNVHTIDFFTDDLEYDFAGVADDDAYNRDAYVAALRESCSTIPETLYDTLIPLLIAACVSPAYYSPDYDRYHDRAFFHYTDSTVDEMTRLLDHAHFARTARDLVNRLIENATDNFERSYVSPRDVLRCMTHLMRIEIAYVPDPDNPILHAHPDNEHHNLMLDPMTCFNDPDLRAAFLNLVPHIETAFIHDEYDPLTRSDF